MRTQRGEQEEPANSFDDAVFAPDYARSPPHDRVSEYDLSGREQSSQLNAMTMHIRRREANVERECGRTDTSLQHRDIQRARDPQRPIRTSGKVHGSRPEELSGPHEEIEEVVLVVEDADRHV